MRTSMRRFAGWGLRACALLAFLPPLLTRITLGHAIFLTGRGKLEHFSNLVSYFTDLGIPFPAANAAVVARLEFYGAILLALGLLTRLTAAALASTMIVALFTERQDFLQSWLPSTEKGPTDVSSFVFLVLLGWLVVYGPGALSLDRLLARWLGMPSGLDAATTNVPRPASTGVSPPVG